MREIKFRAWIPTQNKMIYGETLFASRSIIFELTWKPNKHGGWDEELETIDNGILMQFTGLKDKNGKEIYEGDIVSHTPSKATIVFEHGMFVARFHSTKEWNYPIANELWEVIGNIYENPELLGEEELLERQNNGAK